MTSQLLFSGTFFDQACGCCHDWEEVVWINIWPIKIKDYRYVEDSLKGGKVYSNDIIFAKKIWRRQDKNFFISRNQKSSFFFPHELHTYFLQLFSAKIREANIKKWLESLSLRHCQYAFLSVHYPVVTLGTPIPEVKLIISYK